MAKVTGPLMSFSASGTIGDAITFATWKGIEYARQWFVPGNPQTAKQVNIRTALTLVVALWHDLPQEVKDIWDVFAEGTKMSGFNQWVRRGLKAYILDPGIDVVPTSVTCGDNPPDETWIWNAP